MGNSRSFHSYLSRRSCFQEWYKTPSPIPDDKAYDNAIINELEVIMFDVNHGEKMGGNFVSNQDDDDVVLEDLDEDG